MDRLDSWLARQRGWRAGLLLWLELCPCAAMIGMASWSLFGSGTPGLDLTCLEVLGWSFLAAGLVVIPVPALQSARRKRVAGPAFVPWRAAAAQTLLSVGAGLGIVGGQQPGEHRKVLLGVVLLLTASAAGFAVATVRQARGLRQGTRAGQALAK